MKPSLPAAGLRAHYSPADIAQQFGVAVDKVLLWISRGELRAINVASTASGRPRWKISQDALESFEAVRSNRSAPPAPRRQKHVTKGVVEFYR